jgi:uncharacterized membrane protein YfcA
VLVYVLGYGAKPAIAMSLVVVGLTSAFGAAIHARQGQVRAGTAAVFGVFTMAGAYLGARLSHFLSGGTQLALLAIVMLGAAVAMLRGNREDPSETATRAPAHPGLSALVAVAIGSLTGVVGIGGGFLIVPALVLIARVPIRPAVGTSLAIIAMGSVAGLAGYLGTVSMDLPFLAAFTAAAFAGVLGGAALGRVVPAYALRRGFAAFLIVVAGLVLQQNLGATRDLPSSPDVADPANGPGITSPSEI